VWERERERERERLAAQRTITNYRTIEKVVTRTNF
jgi:hypothetical protein